jgi:hypothetical protein
MNFLVGVAIALPGRKVGICNLIEKLYLQVGTCNQIGPLAFERFVSGLFVL